MTDPLRAARDVLLRAMQDARVYARDRQRIEDAADGMVRAARAAAEARPGLDADGLARAYIRVRGAHMPIADELDGDEEVRPCAWCRLAAEQHIEAARLTEARP